MTVRRVQWVMSTSYSSRLYLIHMHLYIVTARKSLVLTRLNILKDRSILLTYRAHHLSGFLRTPVYVMDEAPPTRFVHQGQLLPSPKKCYPSSHGASPIFAHPSCFCFVDAHFLHTGRCT